MNRQFIYSYDDVGKDKVDICEKYIHEHVLGKVNVEKYKGRIVSSSSLESIIKDFNSSIIVCAADKPQDEISHEVYKVGKDLNIPVISGGVGPDFGSYSFSDSIDQKNIPNSTLLHKREVTYGSFGPTNGCLASLMSNDIIFTLLCEKRWAQCNDTVAVDFNNLKVYKFGLNNE